MKEKATNNNIYMKLNWTKYNLALEKIRKVLISKVLIIGRSLSY